MFRPAVPAVELFAGEKGIERARAGLPSWQPGRPGAGQHDKPAGQGGSRLWNP
jgi:hypothetical protein